MRDSSAMSFILLSESTVAGPGAGPHKELRGPGAAAEANAVKDGPSGEGEPVANGMDRVNRLFQILSARSDVDHPACIECTDVLVRGLQQRLDEALKERDAYVAFLKKKQAESPTEEEDHAHQEALKKFSKEEAGTLEELLRLEKEKATLDEEIAALEDESHQVDLDEEEFWRQRNGFSSKLADFQNERDSINAKFDHDSRLLEKLQRSNVYNDTFCISHDGTFATINGLRLGRMSSKPVDWPEINAAWGHALLLVVTVADKLGYKFDGYEPQPLGSTSKIVRFDQPLPATSRYGAGQRSAPPPAPKRHVLELYSSGDMPRVLPFVHRKFDQAMVAFLELVRQLGAFVQRQTGAGGGDPLQLPYKVEGDRIGDVSIKLGIGQDDGWTKACKLTLTCCKFLLAHASNVNSEANRGNAGS